jgi:hypothetical protein
VEVGTSAAQPGLKFASCPCCHHHHHNHRPPPYTWLFGTSIEAPVHVPTLCNRQTHGGPLPTTHHHPKLWSRCLGSRATQAGGWESQCSGPPSTLTGPTRSSRCQVGPRVKLECSGAVGTALVCAISRPPCSLGGVGRWGLGTGAGTGIRSNYLSIIENAPTMVSHYRYGT